MSEIQAEFLRNYEISFTRTLTIDQTPRKREGPSSEAYIEPCKTSKAERFAKIVNG